MKPVAPSDQMRASGSGRRKVALPPGRSQLDWVRNSARLPRVRTRIVPMRDVRAHNSVDSAWLVVNGKVYDVTPYIEYHPGGVDMILAGAGKDATALFNRYHSWVNLDFMMKACYLGEVNIKDDVEPTSSDSDNDEQADRQSTDTSTHGTTEQVGQNDDALRLAEFQE